MSKSKKAVAFLRVGSVSQNNKQQDFQKQHNIIQQHAHAQKLVIEKSFECIGSAKDAQRVLADVMEYCRQHPEVKVLLVASCDRISRNYKTFIDTYLNFEAIGVRMQASAHTAEDLANQLLRQ